MDTPFDVACGGCDAAVPTGLTVEAEVSWASPAAAIALGPATNRLCYLTEVTGQFDAAGDEVDVRVGGGTWYLNGGSTSGVVEASARCITWSAASGLSMSAESTWSQGDAALGLGSQADRICMLARMAGRWEGAGEWLEITTGSTAWQIDGDSGQVGVAAGVRCLIWPTTSGVAYTAQTEWMQGQAAIALGSTANRACALTGVIGKFS